MVTEVLLSSEEMELARKLAEEEAEAGIVREDLTRFCQLIVMDSWYRWLQKGGAEDGTKQGFGG